MFQGHLVRGLGLRGEQSSRGFDFHPDALREQMRFIGIGEGGLDGEEGTVVAVMVNPAADNVDLIDVGLPDDARRLAKRDGRLQKLAHRLLNAFGRVYHAALLNQATVPDQEEFIAALAQRDGESEEIIPMALNLLDVNRPTQQRFQGRILFGFLKREDEFLAQIANAWGKLEPSKWVMPKT